MEFPISNTLGNLSSLVCGNHTSIHSTVSRLGVIFFSPEPNLL